MPIAKPPKDEPTPQPEEAAAPPVDTPAAPAEAPVPAQAPEPGTYEYSHFADAVYPHVPLTARAATADTPATVFDWPFGPPDDGRWTPTTKTPNQAADNAGPLTSRE
jgi:hypothetical protein